MKGYAIMLNLKKILPFVAFSVLIGCIILVFLKGNHWYPKTIDALIIVTTVILLKLKRKYWVLSIGISGR